MKDFSRFVVAPTDSIHTAMEKITRNKHRAVIVVDAGTVVGSVSDGDIRRAFLNDVLPMAPVERIMNINCRTTTERDPERLRAVLLRVMQTVLPVVDEKGQLVDIALAYEPFGETGVSHTPTEE